MEHSKQLSQIANILDDLFKDNNSYLHFDFTLSSDGTGVKYNVYTSIIDHNAFDNFEEFLLSLKANGYNSIRKRVLQQNLENEIESIKNSEELIEEIQTKLSGYL